MVHVWFVVVSIILVGTTSLLNGEEPPNSGKTWKSVVYSAIDEEHGILTLKANGYLCALAGKPREFQLVRLWRFDPETEKWSKVAMYPSNPAVIRSEKRDLYSAKTDQQLLALTREIALFWAEWKEDGRIVKTILFSGPVQCQDLDVSPPPKGKVTACVPFPDRAEARLVPDPEIKCRE